MGTAYRSPTELDRTFEHGALARVRAGGGWRDTWPTARRMVGKLTAATPRMVEMANARRQQVSHTIIMEGTPVAKPGDRFVLFARSRRYRYFYVNSVEDPGDLGEFSIYGCWEGGEGGVGTT